MKKGQYQYGRMVRVNLTSREYAEFKNMLAAFSEARGRKLTISEFVGERIHETIVRVRRLGTGEIQEMLTVARAARDVPAQIDQYEWNMAFTLLNSLRQRHQRLLRRR